ncbi:heat shock protein 90-5, chloroplastic-like [Silene latifolia]|uniref:heat shock protein 90-5, chloroplastic-like n=1 Tax=Silene latifolia TaxID=37657 RepID=UPI003D779D7B
MFGKRSATKKYVIREETDPEKLLKRGTQITLYLRPDDKYEFSEPTRILNLVKNYSQFVSFPIYTWQEKSRSVEVEEEPTEEDKPEMRNSKEVQKDEYYEFYKKTFNEFLDPLTCTHFTTEGEVEFRSVLYIPGMAPINNEEVVNPKTKNIR